MRKRCDSWLIGTVWLLSAAGNVTGQATPPPEAAATVTMDAAAKAAMSALAFQYEQAFSLQVSCVLSQPIGAHMVDSVQITAAAQKPNLYVLRVSRRGVPLGVMSCDGAKERFFNPATGRSAENDAPTTEQLVQPSLSNALEHQRNMNQVFGKNELVMLQAKSVIAPLFINMLPRPAADTTHSQHYVLTKTRLHGISVTKVEYVVPLSDTGPASSDASVSEAFLNDATGLPIRMIQSMRTQGKKTELYRVDYQTLQLRVMPLPLSTFVGLPAAPVASPPKLP